MNSTGEGLGSVLNDGMYWCMELRGPNELVLRKDKKLLGKYTNTSTLPPHGVVARVECCGLCASDLKLIRAFDKHPRKAPVSRLLAPSLPSGRVAAALGWVQAEREGPGEDPGARGGAVRCGSYVPAMEPGVPGHEAVVRIVGVGSAVTGYRVGERLLVETDYRDLLTETSNAAFGYNFEGALQEFILMDDRIVIHPSGEKFLIPAADHLSASSVALVEPWACVENSFSSLERAGPVKDGSLLIAVECGMAASIEWLPNLRNFYFRPEICPSQATIYLEEEATREIIHSALVGVGSAITFTSSPELLTPQSFDDIVCVGTPSKFVTLASSLLAPGGICNIVQCGRKFPGLIPIDIGRIHYAATRWIGTTTSNPADSFQRMIPSANTDIRDGDRVNIVGGAGPMGQMHVQRCLCSGRRNISISVVDAAQSRLDSLAPKVCDLATNKGIPVSFTAKKESSVDPTDTATLSGFTYYIVMVVDPTLVSKIVDVSDANSIINVFAGIPVGSATPLDLNALIAKGTFIFGTSGSVAQDMHTILGKLNSGVLDTDASVCAVGGLACVQEGLSAMSQQRLTGKVVIYPQAKSCTTLLHLNSHSHNSSGNSPSSSTSCCPWPTVCALLGPRGLWNARAEAEFLKVAT
ncbi:alcohol dehydrogenase [Pelomyxa schiedti]|nr:alcohol dehydrogenase [Pelomyxa schiedti]